MHISEFLTALSQVRGDEVVITTMTAAHEWPAYSNHPLDLNYIVSSMGQGPPLGLGLALAKPKHRIVVVNGDGSLLMNLGALVTIASLKPENYVLINIANGIYEVTGGQPLAGAECVSFTGVAKSAGWENVYSVSTTESLTTQLKSLVNQTGPVFINVEVDPNPEFEVKPKPQMDQAVRILQKNLEP